MHLGPLVRPLLVVALFILAAAPARGQSRSADLGIDTADEYAALIDAIRASEYVRQDFIINAGAPRVVATLAGLAAFADSNSSITLEQYTKFAVDYDTALSSTVAQDPNLARPGAVLAALTQARVEASAELTGMKTNVSADALALLGYELPGLDGLEQAERRMSTFDRRSVARLTHSRAFADLLVANLLGIDKDGNFRLGLAEATEFYLLTQGYDPMLGFVDPTQVEVNAGLASLPNFAGFMQIKSQAEPTAETDALIAGIDAVQLESDAILNAISNTLIADELAQDSAALFDAAAAGDASALAALNAQQAAIEARARAIADERANLFANTILLMQSEFPDVRFEAEAARDFSAIQFEANEGLAIAEQSLGILGSAAAIAGAYATGNVFAGITATADLVSGAIGLGRTLSDEPGPEEQIFNQITELRSQVEGLRVEMNQRFDIVDAKLDTIFQTLVFGLDQINDIALTVDEIVQSIFEVQAQLSRLEEALFLLAEIEFQTLLNTDALSVLEYRQDNGQDLPYASGSTNFVDSTVDFFSFATFTAENPPFVDDSFTLTLENADEEIGDGALGRRFIALNTVPAGLTLPDGTPYSPGAFFGGNVPAPAAWAQPAAMYAQLARENPWYFAFQHANQLASMPGDTDIDRIIANGDDLRTFVTSMRDPQLFGALIENARKGANAAQAAIDADIDSVAGSIATNTDGQLINPWGPVDQGNFQNAVPRLEQIDFSFNENASIPLNAARRGYAISVGNSIDTTIPGVSTRDDLLDRLIMARASNTLPGDNFFVTGFVDDVLPNGDITYLIITALNRGSNQTWIVARELTIDASLSCNDFGGVDPELVNAAMQNLLREGTLTQDLLDGDARDSYDAGVVGVCFFTPQRLFLNIESDITYAGNFDPTDSPDDLDNDIAAGLAALRAQARVIVTDSLVPGEPTAMNAAIEELHDAESILDAYATLALEGAIQRSEILRSALRGFSDVGFRRDNLVSLIGQANAGDTGEIGGSPGIDLPDIGSELNARLDILRAELDDSIALGGPTFPYIEFVLAELESIRAAPFELANDDTYVTLGPFAIDAGSGVIANDTAQAGRTIEVDLGYQGAEPPTNGSLSLNADGSFSYTPNESFTGEDSFTYRLRTLVDESANPVGDPYAYSEPATVVIRVIPVGCPGELAFPFDVLDAADVLEYIRLFESGDPTTDFAAPAGTLNFFDVLSFLQVFDEGC